MEARARLAYGEVGADTPVENWRRWEDAARIGHIAQRCERAGDAGAAEVLYEAANAMAWQAEEGLGGDATAEAKARAVLQAAAAAEEASDRALCGAPAA
eukprot:15456056-Alexandrium_andersonii.AAC.1